MGSNEIPFPAYCVCIALNLVFIILNRNNELVNSFLGGFGFFHCEQNEFAARLSRMEVERQNLAEAVTAAEKKYLDEKRRADDLQQQVKVAKNNLESAKQELVDYKQKATRILQVSETWKKNPI